ncbi:MAG: CapA family protein [Sphingomonas sp.]
MIEFGSRRQVLGGLAALGAQLAASGAAAASRGAARREMRVILLGQAMIQQDICVPGWPDMHKLIRHFRGADVVFTDLEVAILGPLAGAPIRFDTTLHANPPEVIDCLKMLGITLVTTANNHAWDLNTGGILSTIDALKRRNVPFAGTGTDLASASAPAVQPTRKGPFALVAAAAGMIRDGAAATADRPGVNEIRRNADGTLVGEDVERTLGAIRRAKGEGATVLMCLHNHYWEPVQSDTPAWQRRFARACVDAGAAAFVAHGTPLMQGYEIYRGAPLFHGLGNFIFQSRRPERYGPETWQSLIVDATFRDGAFVGAALIPVVLDSAMRDHEYARGWPAFDRTRSIMRLRADG